MTIWVYQSQPGDTCMWEGGSVLDHARRWGREGTLPDPAAAGSDVLINSDIAVQLLFQLLYPPADFIYINFSRGRALDCIYTNFSDRAYSI